MTQQAISSYLVPSRLDAIDGARRWLSDRAGRAGLSAVAVHDVELALTEALTNIVRHAYGGEPGSSIELSLAIDDEALRLEVCDEGVPPFDPSTVPPPDLDNPGRGGYGLMLIDALMDEVAREFREECGTRLSMVKYRTVDAPVP